MSNGYRFIVIGVGGIALFAALSIGAYFGTLYSPNHKQYYAIAGNQNGNSDYQGPSQSLPDIAGLPSPVERAIANPHPATGEDHEKRDLAAQEASALWAFYMVIASFASVVITAFGTAFLYKQIVLTREAVEDTGKATVAMQEANEISRDGMEKQLRAYVHPEGIATDCQPDHANKNFKWGFAINWKNLGVTPVQSASIVIWAEVVDGELPDDFQFGRTANDHVPIVFGPNMALSSVYVWVSADDIKKVFAGEKALYLWGWVKYRDVFPATPERQTRFCYRLFPNGDPTKAVGPDNVWNWRYTIHVNHNSAT